MDTEAASTSSEQEIKPKISQQVLEYIRQKLKEGISEESMKDALIKAGHHPTHIDFHFRYIKKQKNKRLIILTSFLFFILVISFVFYFIYSSANHNLSKKLESYIDKGNALCLRGKYQEANIEFDKALKLNQTRTRVYYHKGRCYAFAGDYDTAISQLAKAVKIYDKYQNISKNPNVYYYLGVSYCEIGNYDEGIANLNIAIQLNNTYQRFYDATGKCYLKKDDIKTSLMWFNKSASVININSSS